MITHETPAEQVGKALMELVGSRVRLTRQGEPAREVTIYAAWQLGHGDPAFTALYGVVAGDGVHDRGALGLDATGRGAPWSVEEITP